MPDLDWDAVRFFLAAAREGSLAGAARVLRVKHTTVGRRLDDLEDALGAKLFHRTTEGLTLTEIGNGVRPVAEEMERAAVRMVDAARVDGDIAGVVRLAVSEAFTGFIVAKLGDLRAAHPRLVVDLLIDNASADLARGEADVAIRMGPVTAPSLICRKLGVFGWSLYATAAYAESHARDAWDLIGYDASLAHSPGARWIEAHIDAARVVVRCNSLLAAANAATSGMGVAALPCFLGASDASLRRVIPDVIGTREAFLLVHPDRQHTPRVRVVLDYVQRVVAANAATNAG